MPSSKKLESMRKAMEAKERLKNSLNAVAEKIGDEDIGIKSRSSNAEPPEAPEKNRKNPFGWVDIITFAEHPYFLGLNLTPWQKIILKVFYSGREGNYDLELTKEKPEEGCEGCSWEYNKKSEETVVKQFKDDPDFVEEVPPLPIENSPCLTCKRLKDAVRKNRIKYAKHAAISEFDKEDIEKLKDRPIQDNYTTEEDLLADKSLNEGMSANLKQRFGRRFKDLVLVLGRRSGKSWISAIISCYEAYCLMMMGHPQTHITKSIDRFGSIGICNVAVSEEQAKSTLFQKIKQLTSSSPYFRDKIGKETELQMHFLTKADKEENEKRAMYGASPLTGTVQIRCGHSNSKSLVGNDMLIVIIDEMAELGNTVGSAGADRDLYEKLTPAMSTFGKHAKIICISNPLGKRGKFYELYQESFEDQGMLMFQLPTWVCNPMVSRDYLESEKRKLKSAFNIYYGAQFGDQATDPYIPPEYVDYAFNIAPKSRGRLEKGEDGVEYFMHLDPAKSSDYYTLAIVHTEESGERGPDGKMLMKVVVDHIHYWIPEGPNRPVKLDEVDRYVIDLIKKFNFGMITYDGWNSLGSIQKISAFIGPSRVKETSFGPKFQSEIYGNLLDLFESERIEFYGKSTVAQFNGKEVMLKELDEASIQFKHLQRKRVGKRTKVEAELGYRDDIPDCVAAAALQALTTTVYRPLAAVKSTRIGFAGY